MKSAKLIFLHLIMKNISKIYMLFATMMNVLWVQIFENSTSLWF